MNKYQKLFSNSFIFTIGSFGSRIINLIMIPLYTQALTTVEYGTVDIIITSVSLLMPLVTLSLSQAALRFAIDAKNDLERNIIFQNLTTHIITVTALLILLSPIIYQFNFFENYKFLFLVLLIIKLANDIYSQYLRGIGLVKQFAFNGILTTLVTVLSNILFLLVFDYGINGYIISIILATIVSNIYIFLNIEGFKRIKKFNVDKKLYRQMLNFSVPMIPNSMMWWIINGSTKYFIAYFVGSAGNGIYAVATKIPSLISVITEIFSQAWQISSFEEYESESRDEFFSNIYNIYWVCLFCVASIIMIVLKPALLFIIDVAYYDSWKVVPFLLLGVVYQSLAGFLGTNYTASKKTKGAFTTSVYAGIVSIISSYLFTPIFGVVGAGVSTFLSFFSMFIIRFLDTKKFVSIEFNIVKFLITNLIFLVQIACLFIFSSSVSVTVQVLLFLSICLINFKMMVKLLGLVKLLYYKVFKKFVK